MNFLRGIFSVGLIFWITNCGGEAGVSIVSISPNQPFLFTESRRFVQGFELIEINKPSTSFKILIDNQGNASPLTVITARLIVNGPKGQKTVIIDPLTDLYLESTTTEVSRNPRSIIAEVRPYQASFCMDKVTYLKEENYERPCDEIALDPLKIQEHGVSAAFTTGDADSRTCCPTGTGNLSNIVVMVGGLQEYSEDELVPLGESYGINAIFTGFYGTYFEPVANFSGQTSFTVRSN